MARLFILMIMLYAILLTGCALMSQQPTAATAPEESSQGVPTATVAPAQQTPAQAVAVTSQPVTATPTAQPVPFTSAPVVATSAPMQSASSLDDSMDRVERRKMKQQRFAASIDSLVQSHSFRFLPNSMQELPGGFTQLIYNELFFVGVFRDHVEVHMPTVRGNMVQYIEILNFDTFEVKNYQVSRTQFGWSISFNMITANEANYAVSLMVYTLTGEAVLNLLTLSNTVRYVGYIQPLSKN